MITDTERLELLLPIIHKFLESTRDIEEDKLHLDKNALVEIYKLYLTFRREYITYHINVSNIIISSKRTA
jgi:hypothetical protein